MPSNARTVAFLCAAVTLAAAPLAGAATCTWQSTSSQLWSVAANWSCGHTPAAGDDVVFPAGAGLQLTTNNDAPSFLVIGSISFTGGGYAVSGSQCFVTAGGITANAATASTITMPISIGVTNQNITNNGTGKLIFSGAGGIAGNMYIVTFTGTGAIDVLSPISGTNAGGIVKLGTGTLTFGAANTYDGITVINAGILHTGDSSALGSVVGGTTLAGTGQLEVFAPTTAEALTIVSSGNPAVTFLGQETWSGSIALGADATFNSTTAGGVITVSGVISGAKKLTLTGGAFSLQGANTFSGGLLVQTNLGGSSKAGGTSPFGSGSVTVDHSALSLSSSALYSNPFVIDDHDAANHPALAGNGGVTALSGPVTLVGSPTLYAGYSDVLTLSGPVGGGGAGSILTKTGVGGLNVAGSCTYVGATHIAAGYIGLQASNVLPSSTALDISAGAYLTLSDHAQTLAALSGGGEVTFGDGGTAVLTVGDASNTTFSGDFNAFGTLIFTGAGEKTLTGASPNFQGSLQVNAGIVSLNGAKLPTAITAVAAGGKLALGADALTGAVTVTGGVLAPGSAAPRSSASGDVTLDAAAKLEAQLDGLGSGEHTQLTVSGSVDLGGATLDLALGYAAQIGDAFTLIDNDGVDAVVGTFAGLAEGSTFLAGDAMLVISYVGGSGNDVVVTVLSPPSVDDAGTLDGGVGEDAGTSDDAAIDAGPGSDEQGGCSAVGNRGVAAWPAILLTLLGLLCVCSRRCGSRSAPSR